MLSIKLFRLAFCLFLFNVRQETFSLILNAQIWAKNMLSIKLFRLAFCLFRFNRNIETLFSVQKRNNRNKCFVSDSAEASFGSSFGCFESKLVSKVTLARILPRRFSITVYFSLLPPHPLPSPPPQSSRLCNLAGVLREIHVHPSRFLPPDQSNYAKSGSNFTHIDLQISKFSNMAVLYVQQVIHTLLFSTGTEKIMELYCSVDCRTLVLLDLFLLRKKNLQLFFSCGMF